MSLQISKIIASIQEYEPKLYITESVEITDWKYITKNQTEFLPNYLYIGKTSSLCNVPSSVKTSLILLEDSNLIEFDLKESDTNFILLNIDCNLDSISERIESLFIDQQKLGDCTIKILQACQHGKTTQQILDLGFQMLKNPLLLVDLSLCFIAQSGGDTIKDEPLWEWTLSKGYVTEEYVQSVMVPDMNDFKSEFNCNSNIFWNNELLNHRQLVGRVAHEKKPMSYLKLLEFNKPITSSDEQILDMLCNFLAITMKDPNITSPLSNNLIDSFLIALLNQKIYDHDAIEERKHLFGLKLYENLFVITIEIENHPNTNDRLYYLKRIFQSYFNRQTILIYNGHIVIVLDCMTKELTENTLSLLENLLIKNNCIAGISQVFYNLHELSEYYKQSISSLYLGGLLQSQQRILKYDDYIIPHMILHFHGETSIKNLIHPAVVTLKKIDEKKGTDFLKTLITYINYNQNITLASKALHIHYNTVKYRIKRIEDLSNIDFLNSETLFHICLSSKVLDIMKYL